MYPLPLYIPSMVPTILHLHICYQLFSVIATHFKSHMNLSIHKKIYPRESEHKVTEVYMYRFKSYARIHIFCQLS